VCDVPGLADHPAQRTHVWKDPAESVS
jgi:hypothetical protein